MSITETLRPRLTAAAIHLLLSGLIAACVAVVTLRFWYPGEIGAIAGGRQLFLLILSVDVVMGPLLTLVVFDRRKPRGELIRDLAIIGVLQLAALGYGLHALYVARPVALVYEPGRFRVLSAKDVRVQELPDALPEYRELSLSGPVLLGTRAAKSGEERVKSLDLALEGYDIGQRPSFWQPYAQSRAQAWAEAKPLDELMNRYPARRAELMARVEALKLKPQDGRYLPLLARGDWVVILDAHGDIAGYAPFDGF
jgi:hypothetical protein